MAYFNDEFWHATINLTEKIEIDQLTYRYILHEPDGTTIVEGEQDRNIDLYNSSANEIILLDTWNSSAFIENTFYTKAFQQVLLKTNRKKTELNSSKFVTHEFRIKAPLLKADETVCICGTGKLFDDWNTDKPILLSLSGKWFTARLNLRKEEFPVEYKYGVYNTLEKKFIQFESGNNRILYGEGSKKRLNILHDGFLQVPAGWKGAGVAIPVFSLRTKKSFGVGEFSDIKLLADWASTAGLKLIQLLPINDTIATHTSMDSYPYAAISAFALHPLYINLDTVAGTKHVALIKPLKRKQKQLNLLADVNYEEVMRFKISVLQELYHAEKETLKSDPLYFEFFEFNRKWLVPYAAFCFLRDKNKTPDFTKWKSNKSYDEDSIQQLVSPGQKHYHDIAIYYFIQYHLHLQLKEAVEYAHNLGTVIKGDIPIGIYRYGCDAWMNPQLYNMDEQAGAPPDDFAVKGQNWGFPTYRWDKMQQDGFSWWRNRFEQMSNYFDAFRIDHILGFFRIWSIPVDSVEGIMGRFVPAVPVHISEFLNNNIWFDYDRYCKPFINDSVIGSVCYGHIDFVKEKFLEPIPGGMYRLKTAYNTQQKINQFFLENEIDGAAEIRKGLFDLVSNIILVEDGTQHENFHFRIEAFKTLSYNNLEANTRNKLYDLYVNYFFRRQDDFWRKQGMEKLPELKRSTNMLVCGEDLGMVPACVPEVMKQLAILSLEIQRMPKDNTREFFHPRDAPYLSVVTPSTHDMSTVRGWWEEDKAKIQKFYNYIMGHYGEAPYFCEWWINKEIILQHLYSPAMWSIFQIQDLLGMSQTLRRENPMEERINQPADPKHLWKYRMHINLEDLVKEKEFNEELKKNIVASGR
jgi:4-alpha-glucanotransferase